MVTRKQSQRMQPTVHLLHLLADWRAQCGQRSFRWVAFGSRNTELGWHSEGRHGWACWLSCIIHAVARSTGAALIDQYSWFLPWQQHDVAAYRPILRDPMHLKPVGNALMGTLAGRVCGLPDPEYPPDWGPAVPECLANMSRWATLPAPVSEEI